MSDIKITELVSKLSKKGKMVFPNPASEEQVFLFENSNKIKFPQKFKEWLLFTDGGDLYLPAGVQFYGVAHKPLIDVDYSDRPSEDYIVIGSLCTGDPILIKTGSEKIYIYNHEDNRIEEDEVYEDFFEFINDLDNYLGIGV